MARLMVVDDEPDLRDLIVKRLIREGHQVLAADGGLAALGLVRQHGVPDAAILDLDMPGMDGFALLDRLRETCPRLPALFLTVLWAGDVAARIEHASASYLAKPFTAVTLAAAVRHLLGPAVSAAGGGPVDR